MKKTIISICTLLAFAGGAYADDTFSLDNVTLPQNGEADVVVRFSLDEGSTCSGYTFWLQVPEELTFATYEKNGKTNVTYTAGDSYDETPTITPNIDGGYLKVGCLTANSDPLNKQSGVLVTFRIKPNAVVNVGDTFTGTLTKGKISAENGTVHDVANATFTITIGAPVDTRTILDETSTTAPETSNGAVDVRVKRTIIAEEWSTICLPFAMTAEQVKAAFGDDVQLGDADSYKTTEDDAGDIVGINIKFNNVTAIEANHPYIIKVSKDIRSFDVDGVDVAPAEKERNRRKSLGTSSYFVGNYVNQTEVPEFCLFLSGNKFWYSIGETKMKAFRGYFNLKDVLSEVEDASSSRISISFDNSTGINDNRQETIDNERCYDLLGRRVGTSLVNGEKRIVNSGQLKKGVYIVNGKKIIK